MMAFERRWAESILEAFAPPGGPGLAPRAGETRYAEALERMAASATRTAALGMRLALWLAVVAPVLVWGRLVLAPTLAIGERARMLGELLRHRSFLVRELVLLLKITAAFALFARPEMRAASNYDRTLQVAAETAEQIEESGERQRVRLAVVTVGERGREVA